VNDQPAVLGTPPETRASLDPLLVAIVRALRSIEQRTAIQAHLDDGFDDDGEALAA
jgi:hypothetical protein